MKTIEITLYKFEELSENAKKSAIEKWRDSTEEYFSLDEIESSLQAFCEAFNIKLKNYSLGYNSNIDARLGHIDDAILELSGPRLLAYLYNNYIDILYERKGYGKYEKKANGKFDYKRRSHINIIDTNCPFTGVCYDEDFLDPIRKFMLKPVNTTFEQLLRDCISEGETAAENAVEYENSDSYITETIIANDYDFNEDGSMY